jgi:hypothetical protein
MKRKEEKRRGRKEEEAFLYSSPHPSLGRTAVVDSMIRVLVQ